jgi:hypothetical protein
MEIQVAVQIPDPKFPKGTMLATPHSHVLHVVDVISELVRSSAVYAGSGRPGVAPHRHTYILVVQRSPNLRPGSVLVTQDSPSSVLHQCRTLRKHQGEIIGPDSLDNVLERTHRSQGR